MHRRALALILWAAASSATYAQPSETASAPALAGLAAWVGCAPICPAAAARSRPRLRSAFVLDFPPLHSELERLLGRRSWAELKRLAQTGPPIDRRGDWARIVLCRAAACATEFMVLFVHLPAAQIALCWHEERWMPHQLRWSDNRGGVWRTGTGRQPLPPEGCNNRGAFLGHDWDLLRRLSDP
jgi:hypothetical protein